MRTYITIENEKSAQFEDALIQFDLIEELEEIRERDFMTDFIFNYLSDDEEHTLETIKSDCL